MTHQAMYTSIINMHIPILEADKSIWAIRLAYLATNTEGRLPQDVFKCRNEENLILCIAGFEAEF